MKIDVKELHFNTQNKMLQENKFFMFERFSHVKYTLRYFSLIFFQIVNDSAGSQCTAQFCRHSAALVLSDSYYWYFIIAKVFLIT